MPHPLQDEYTLFYSIPLKDVVIFPGSISALFIGREKSVHALEMAKIEQNNYLFLITQQDGTVDEPGTDELHDIGTISRILQMVRLADGTIKVLVEGLKRAQLNQMFVNEEGYLANITTLADTYTSTWNMDEHRHLLVKQFQALHKLHKKIPSDILKQIEESKDITTVLDQICANIDIDVQQQQTALSTINVEQRCQLVMEYLELEIEKLQAENNIRNQVKKQMDANQREYFLNEKLKAVKKEINDLRKQKRENNNTSAIEETHDDDGEPLDEIDVLKQKIEQLGLKGDAKDKARQEIKKLSMMPPQSSEATISRNYLDWFIDLPWKKRSRVSKDLDRAQRILDVHHYGLDKVKERIIEYLAVQKRTNKVSGNILCLVGPPGVGKTSLAKSIAEATNRHYTRIALGGVRDEAEIRGHRRTYLGAMPGKILQQMAKAGTKNPLMLLDEIDKIGQDHRGDPAAALLEVLDPEQNQHFNDHYLEVDYDLSDVLFIATANSLEIPEALRDRMEVIQLSGYTENEKQHIAKLLWDKQKSQHKLSDDEVILEPDTILTIIREYTKEAGVRSLDREIAKIARKALTDIVTDKADTIHLNDAKVRDYLGVEKYRFGLAQSENHVGQVTGLAWTKVGGELLTIEAVTPIGKGKLQRTGKLGDVMQESIETALSLIRQRSQRLGIAEDFYETTDFHIHVPEGATPKDGPSAGIAMTTALVSSLTNIPVRCDVAMTGEITLRGEVLPIGGLKEKLLAAARGGIKTVLIPKDNLKDLTDIEADITDPLNIIAVEWIDDVFTHALADTPSPITMPDPHNTEASNAMSGASVVN